MPHLHVAATRGVVTLDVGGERLFLSPEQATLVAADILDAAVDFGDAQVDGTPLIVVVVGEARLALPMDAARVLAVKLATAADAAD